MVQTLPPPATYPTPVPQAPPRQTSRAGRIVASIFVTALIAMAAQQAGLLLHDTSPQHPPTWDPRVRDLVAYVEEARGHRFDHPVPVYFLTADEYRAASQGGAEVAEPTQAERRDSANDAAELRAMGMLEGDPDLLDAGNDLADAGTLAFYDQDADVVNVRGKDMSVGLRVTLVHELTHALQDQTFDVVRLLDTDDSERATAVRAVIEGDASAVEQQYVSELSSQEQEEYDTESTGQADDAESDLEGVPDVLTTLFGLPYALGTAFVDLVDAEAGGIDLANIDSVFARMPATTAQLFTARDYFDDVPVERVEAPKVRGRIHDEDQLGAGQLFVMLSERIDPGTAMEAVDGWRGDGFRAGIAKTPDGVEQLCIAARIRMASPEDATELGDALGTWRESMPAEAEVQVDADGGDVVLRSCDPGPDADMGLTGKSADALVYPVVRNELAAGQVTAGMDRDAALCVGEEVLPELTPEELSAEELTDELQSKLTDLILDAMDGC